MSEPDEDKEKLTRVEASLRERERQVYAQQAEFMNEREKEKERHVKEKATQHFMALMSDMVSIYWHRVETYRDELTVVNTAEDYVIMYPLFFRRPGEK
jgi:hypothetical protein